MKIGSKSTGRPDEIVTIRGVMGVCHLLIEGGSGDVAMLDTGLIGEPAQIRWKLWRRGLGAENVKAILLTHGHLDHAGHLAWAKAWTGAPIYAHPLEQMHIDGTFPYCGPNAWCGRLERAGRKVLGVGAPAKIDVAIEDGDELPIWGGLRVVHLPGHTLGHCGFYSARHDVLFSGDLFASYFFRGGVLPPRILNSAPELILRSLRKAQALNPRRMVPQHYDFLDCALHRRRFDGLMERIAWKMGERAWRAV